MRNDLLIFSLEFVIFFLTYLFVINNSSVQNFIFKFKNFKLLIFLIFIVQLVAIALIKYNVVDVFINSDAGKNLLDGVDIYGIDVDHSKYPFFPFLIFLHAGLVFIWQKVQVFTYNFYFKVVLLGFLHLLGMLFYKEWKLKNLKEAKINLVSFLISPITYAIILYHGQFDIILITFLYLAIKMFTKSWVYSSFISSSVLFAASIATKTWSIILLPIFAIPLLKRFSIKEITKFSIFVSMVVGLLLINIKFYTLQVYGSNTRIVLDAIIHPGGPTGIWGLGLLLKPFFQNSLNFLSKLQIVGLGVFWTYVYYQVKFFKKNFNYYHLVLMSVLVFHLLTPRWEIQYIFWHFPFLMLLTGTKIVRNWIYQLVIPIYLFLNYCNVTVQGELITPWIVWVLGLFIYIYWVKLLINLIRTKSGYLTN